MSERLTAEQIRELQALPFPRCEDITKAKIAGDYFSHFLPYWPKCVGCGATLGGLFGSFTWGLAHGHGFCSVCFYPAVAYHRLGDEWARVILQAHPEELFLPETAEETRRGDERARELIRRF